MESFINLRRDGDLRGFSFIVLEQLGLCVEAVLLYLSIYSSIGFPEEPFFALEFSNLFGPIYGREFLGDRTLGVYSARYFIFLRVH